MLFDRFQDKVRRNQAGQFPIVNRSEFIIIWREFVVCLTKFLVHLQKESIFQRIISILLR